jgi:hypothetical protein
MTAPAPFVAGLRVRRDIVSIGGSAPDRISVRVEMPEVWDTVRVETSSSTPVSELKRRALEELYPDALPSEDVMLKLRGFEVLDERASLKEAGAVDGSIFLMTFRRRRPVR